MATGLEEVDFSVRTAPLVSQTSVSISQNWPKGQDAAFCEKHNSCYASLGHATQTQKSALQPLIRCS